MPQFRPKLPTLPALPNLGSRPPGHQAADTAWRLDPTEVARNDVADAAAPDRPEKPGKAASTLAAAGSALAAAGAAAL